MPIVIVGYSGGFVPPRGQPRTSAESAIESLRCRPARCGLTGELDKFSSWIVKNRTRFFVSAYTRYTQRHDQQLMQMIRDKGIAVSTTWTVRCVPAAWSL